MEPTHHGQGSYSGAGGLCPVQWQTDGTSLNSLQMALGKMQLVVDAAWKEGGDHLCSVPPLPPHLVCDNICSAPEAPD